MRRAFFSLNIKHGSEDSVDGTGPIGPDIYMFIHEILTTYSHTRGKGRVDYFRSSLLAFAGQWTELIDLHVVGRLTRTAMGFHHLHRKTKYTIPSKETASKKERERESNRGWKIGVGPVFQEKQERKNYGQTHIKKSALLA